MIIFRDGQHYKLTENELYNAYMEVKHNNFVEDVIYKAEDIGVNLEGKNVDDIAYTAKDALDNDDSYWESYWMAIESAIKQF